MAKIPGPGEKSDDVSSRIPGPGAPKPGKKIAAVRKPRAKKKDDITVKPKFKSGAQSAYSMGSSFGQNLQRQSQALYLSRNKEKLYDEMMRDPTIRIAVDVLTAMLKRVPWTVEGDDADYCTFLWEQVEPWRELIIQSSLRGMLRDGWRAFEVIYEMNEELMFNGIAGIKALRKAYTQPLVFKDSGEFAGLEIRDKDNRQETVDKEHSFVVNFDEDGFGDLGQPLLAVCEGPHRKWEKCDEGAQRYDQKVAGGFLFIQYPVGSTPYSPRGGEETDNAEIMKELAASFEAAGFAGAPRLTDPDTGKPLDAGWTVEHVSAGGGLQPNFVVRAKYLDALKLRALGVPERVATEGTFGTKAESESHADVAILINMDRCGKILDEINEGPVTALNCANKDDPDAARFVLGKLDPADRELFAQIFTSLMADPVFGEQIAQNVDVLELLDKLNVPTKDPAEQDAMLGGPRIPGPGQIAGPGMSTGARMPGPGDPPPGTAGTGRIPGPGESGKIELV